MEKELERIRTRMAQINEEVESLNSACAEELAKLTEGVTSRILSFAQKEELESTVEKYTKRIAKLLVELEELEEEKKIWEEE